MEQVLKILKINALSLLAIPLLLLATFFKLVAKAFEKITIFLILLLAAVIVLSLMYVAPSPKDAFELIRNVLIAAGIFGAVIFFAGWIFALISAFAIVAWNLAISLFDTLYDFTYTGYLSLYASCEADYRLLSLNGRKVPNAIACIFFTILKGLSYAITFLVSMSYILAIGISVLLVLFTLLDLNGNVKASFGMTLMQYAGKCDLHSLIAGILTYLVFMGIIIVGIMALASEWHEWGKELRMTSQEITRKVKELIKSDLRMASGSAEEVEKYMPYLKEIESHLEELEPLSKQVSSILDQKDNPLLRSYWGVYMRTLNPLVEQCSDKKGMDVKRFKQLIPQIQLLDKQRADVQKLADKLSKELQNPSGTSVFFAGCDTLDKLEKRYKALCKTYHPDIAEGDTATFQKMQAEYHSLKATLSAPPAKADKGAIVKKEK